MNERSISVYDDYLDDVVPAKEGEGFFSPFTFLCSVLILFLFGLVCLLSSSMDLALNLGLPFWSCFGKQLLGAVIGGILGISVYFVPEEKFKCIHFITGPISLFLLIISTFKPQFSFLRDAGGSLSLFSIVYLMVWAVPFVMERERKGFPLLFIMPFSIAFIAFIGYSAGLGWYILGLIIILSSAAVYKPGNGYLFFFAVSGIVILFLLLSFVPSLFQSVTMSMFPTNDISLYSENLLISRMAIIDGGMTGSGLGQGLYKLGAISNPHKEFIFATIFEETGLLGLFCILIPSLIILIVCVRTANRATKNNSLSVAASVIGLSVFLIFPIFLNILYILSFYPFQGLILPFFSYSPISEGIFAFTAVVLYRQIYKEGRKKNDKE